jgi:tetratricopeptide (TPR) repeat protein
MVKPVQALANKDSIRTLSLVVGALLVATPAVAAAQSPAAQSPAAEAQTPAAEAQSPAQQAQALFKDGAAQYKLSNYANAVDKFSAAFVLSLEIDDDDLRGKVLHALQFNLARAHVKTYDIDEDVEHLRTAVDLLEKYLNEGAELGIELEADALIGKAKGELKARKQAAEGGEENPQEALVSAGTSPPRDRGPAKAGRPLMLAGYVSLGLAGASLGIMVGGLVMANAASKEAEDATTGSLYTAADGKGSMGNALFYAGVAGAAVFAGTGAALLVLGKKKSRSGNTARTLWSPMLSTREMGLQIKGSF